MLLRIKHKGLAEIFETSASRHIDKRFHRTCLLILDHLDAATCPQDLGGVKNFHQLSGSRAGSYSMHVNGNWCITFRFDGPNITDVDFEDYH